MESREKEEKAMFEAERHENLFHRVSIRRYEDRPVEDEKIRQILKRRQQYLPLQDGMPLPAKELF